MKIRRLIAACAGVATLLSTVSSVSISAHAYNGQAAANYAVAWSGCVPPYTYNSYYVAQTNDCTNFASQCLKAGGWQMTDDSATGFFDGVTAISEDSWYYLKSTNPITQTEHNSWSSTWTLVDQVWPKDGLREYTTEHAFVHENVTASAVANVLARIWGVGKGDVIQIDFNGDGDYDHSVIVTEAFTVYVYGEPKTDVVLCTYHTNDTLMKSFADIIDGFSNAKINIIKANYGNDY